MNNNLKKCPNCGTENSNDSVFCINCGSKIEELSNINSNIINNNVLGNESLHQNIVNQPVEQEQIVDNQRLINNQVTQQNSVHTNLNNTVSQSVTNNSITNSSINYLKYILNVLLKPCVEFKNQEVNFTNFKYSGLLTLIVAGFITIVNLITTMYNSVRVSSYFSDEVEWVWENLKDLNYIKLIGQNLLVCAIGIFVLSGIYFLASLIIKKDVKFSKFLAIASTSIIPVAISCLIISPLISMIFAELGIIVNIVGVIYGYIMFLGLIDSVVGLDNKDIKIYYHTACLSIFMIIILVILYITIGSVFDIIGY